MKEKLTIGCLAKLANVNVETIRYYERIGLIKQPSNKIGRYRVYQESDITRVKSIKRAKELGFTLKDISKLLSLNEIDDSCLSVREIASENLFMINQKIDSLNKLKERLSELVNSCDEKEAIKDCPILDVILN